MTAPRLPLHRANLLLVLLLLAGQLAVMAHAFEHDPGAPQSQACATCIAVTHLGAAAVTEPLALDLPQARCAVPCAVPVLPVSADVATVRQRGPPPFLPML